VQNTQNMYGSVTLNVLSCFVRVVAERYRVDIHVG